MRKKQFQELLTKNPRKAVRLLTQDLKLRKKFEKWTQVLDLLRPAHTGKKRASIAGSAGESR